MSNRLTEEGGVDFTQTVMSKSYLTYLIPSSTSFSLDYLATGHNKPTTSVKALLGSIEQRESLFFDETVTVLLVLKTPVPSGSSRDPKKYLRTIAPRLVIDLEASVRNANAPGGTTPPLQDVISTETIDDANEPLIICNGQEEGGEGEEGEEREEREGGEDNNSAGFESWAYAAWTVSVFLQRPQMRLQDPSVVLKATATLKPTLDDPSAPPQPSSPSRGQRPANYLTPGRPSSLNLLASLAADPTIASYTPIPPRLSALRVSRVAPITQARDVGIPLRALERIKLLVHPALQTRMRLSRPAGTSLPPSRSGMVAVVEVEFTPHSDCEMLLDGIEMSIAGALVEDLGEGVSGLAFPLRCVAHDHLTFLYRITPATLEVGSDFDSVATLLRGQQLVRELGITVRVTALILPGISTPLLVMNWSAPIDFSAPVNPGYAPVLQPMQRLHRPSHTSIYAGARDGRDAATSLISPSVTRPDSLPVLDEAVAAAAALTAEMAVPDLGITVTFSAPPSPVTVGEDFTWTVHVVNRTSEKNPGISPRKLALMALPWRKHTDATASRGPPGSMRPVLRTKNQSGQMASANISDAVVDQASVYAMQRNAQPELSDVVCLSADARVGPLLPGACHVTEMGFIALSEGILGVEAIRVIDLGSQEHVDVRELPVMTVKGLETH